ncbi:GGDEF domain-containing protein [Oxalobacteraceae bacterium OM1]|nr:GGDEF domain-containing protein [Oxalobacteraceae bacterium OM1]
MLFLRLSDDESDTNYIELLRELFSVRGPTTVAGILWTLVGGLLALRTGDTWLKLIFCMGLALALVRIWVIWGPLKRMTLHAQEADRARRVERWFLLGSWSFAACIGMLGVRVFQVGQAEQHMLFIGYVFTYGAGMAIRAYLRPVMCIGAIALASIAPAVAMLTRPEAEYFGVGIILLLMGTTGIESVLFLYRRAVAQIKTRLQLEQMAQVDALTGLGNRHALNERAHRLSRSKVRGELLAVLCIDLDKFKPVNDTLGHAAGDDLLVAVSKRIAAQLRAEEFAARMGGDEFLIVRSRLHSVEQAQQLAERLVAALNAPYAIHEHVLQVGASIGVAVGLAESDSLDALMNLADSALYEVKAAGGAAFRLALSAAVQHAA